MVENGPKTWFLNFLKNHVINFVWNLCKTKVLWFINIPRKLHVWEKSGSPVIVKNGSQRMRFQYSLMVNISLID